MTITVGEGEVHLSLPHVLARWTAQSLRTGSGWGGFWLGSAGRAVTCAAVMVTDRLWRVEADEVLPGRLVVGWVRACGPGLAISRLSADASASNSSNWPLRGKTSSSHCTWSSGVRRWCVRPFPRGRAPGARGGAARPGEGRTYPLPRTAGGARARLRPGARTAPIDIPKTLTCASPAKPQAREGGDGLQPVRGYPAGDALDALVGDEPLADGRRHRRRHPVAVVGAVDRDGREPLRGEPAAHLQVAFAALVAAAAVEHQHRRLRCRGLR